MAVRDKAMDIWKRGMSAVGNTAANIAGSTRQKMDILSLQNRRKEVMGQISLTVYALWQDGTEMPGSVTALLEELQRLDSRISALQIPKEPEVPAGAADGPGDTPEETEEDAQEPEVSPEITQKQPETPPDAVPGGFPPALADVLPSFPESPVESEINGYFDVDNAVGRMAEKVNSTLEQMTERIHRFRTKGDEPGSTETENTKTDTEETE